MIDAVSWISSRIAPTATQGIDRLQSAHQAAAVKETNALSFGQVFEQVSREAIESVRGAETTSVAALQGQASTLEVVESIKSAEQALQTATAVRDKIVQAYQEVSRMAI
jgi:flagellar hook-basal body complex protein FliE